MEATLTASPERPAEQRVGVIFGALMLVLLLASLDQTIVSTALPTIVGELGGVEHLSWVVTAYLLASTVAGPLYGKLGDLYGRKIVLQAAIVIFLAGSVLCGLSQNMTELILFRAVQGLGGGGLMVVTLAVVGDVVAPRERGRYQGFFGAVFAVSTVVGPLLGGFFVDNLSWRWIFYVNLPIGAVALAVIAVAFHARARHVRHAIDYAGAALLAAALAAIVLYTSLGGTTYPWGGAGMLALLAGGVAALGAFVLVERRASEPILPLSLFRNGVFAVTSAVGFVIGLALFGAVTFLPLYLQDVKGHSATESGLLLTPMMAGLLVTSIASGQLISRTGRYRRFPIIGTAITVVGFLLLSRLAPDTSTLAVGAAMLVLGLGLGMVMQVLVLAAQNAVPYELLGVATSGSTLFRQVGGSIGVALFGAIFANRLQSELSERLPPGTSLPAQADPAAVAALPPAVHEVYVTAITDAIRPVFLTAAVLAAIAFALSWLLREVPLRATAQSRDPGRGLEPASEDDRVRAVQRALAELSRREERWELYERLARRGAIDLPPPELWLLARLGERAPLPAEELSRQLPVDGRELEELLATLRGRGLVDGAAALELTPEGQALHARLVAARRAGLAERLEGLEPAAHPELQAILDELAHDLVRAIPAPPARV